MPAVTLVEEAVRQLSSWMTKSGLKPGARLPSERNLAQELGLGHYAVNRAMGRLIAEGRVERQGYKLFVARDDAVSSVARIACRLVIARRSQYHAAYRRSARALDVDLTVHTWEAAEEVAAILDQFDAKNTDGVLCDPPADPAQTAWIPAALRLQRRGVPFVSMAWATDDLSSVTSNTTHGIELAINHLAELGHRELALVTFPSVTARGGEITELWKNICARSRLYSSGERVHFDASWLAGAEDNARLADILVGPWRPVTGLVIRVGHPCAIHLLLAELARRGRRVPESLSIFAVGHARSLHTADPRITSAATDIALWHETAFDLVRREAGKRRQLGATPPPSILQVMPRLNLRESTSPSGEPFRPRSPRLAADEAPAPARHAVPPADEFTQLIRRPYPLAAKASLAEKSRFASVDLRPFVNRPLTFRRGWLGDLPLRCLPPGPHEIHGVPFDILGGTGRADLGAVVLHSAINSVGNAQRLPDRVVIPLNQRVEVVYILHGCGYARAFQTFAHYAFHRKQGRPDTVPIVSLGQGPAEAPANANIQDWWSDYPHRDFEGARMVPLLDHDEGSPVNRHVFLYTLEWINPSPARPLTNLEIVADPSVATTLGLLAVTLVKPRGA